MSKTIPVTIRYKDKIDATRQMLQIYSKVSTHLTKRNIDLLTICILDGINSKNFRRMVIKSDLGFKNEAQINTELSRLKKKGIIEDDNLTKDKHLTGGVEQIEKMINGGDDKFGLYIAFEPK